MSKTENDLTGIRNLAAQILCEARERRDEAAVKYPATFENDYRCVWNVVIFARETARRRACNALTGTKWDARDVALATQDACAGALLDALLARVLAAATQR